MQDLNTRLRRVITAYQRNYKKEELKQQQKAKVGILLLKPLIQFIISSSFLIGKVEGFKSCFRKFEKSVGFEVCSSIILIICTLIDGAGNFKINFKIDS